MPRIKKKRLRKRIPPNKRIPGEKGCFTRAARDLYDLIYTFGLGGCWMSNETIADRLCYCTRTIRRCRQQLVKRQVIITARTCPHTWIMWSRYHLAVQNCQVLCYPVRKKMDNPWYPIPAITVGGTKTASGGDKMSTKLDVITLKSYYNDPSKRRSVILQPTASLSQGSAPNLASPSGSTGDQRVSVDPKEENSQLVGFEVILFKQYYAKFAKMGYEKERSCSLAMAKIIARREGKKDKV